MRRVGFILFFILGIIGPIYFYLGWSLGSGMSWPLLAILFGLVFSFPFMRHRPLITHLTFLSMGFLSFLIVFVILKDLLGLIGLTIPALWSYVAAGAAVVIGTLIAHRGPTIVKLKLPYKQLPPELEGFRIAQISDLHIGPTIGQKYVEKIITTVNEMNVDMVALTGDIGDGPVEKYRDAIAPFLFLKSKFGVFYVPGNHEYYWNANEWMNIMNNFKAIVLLNRGKNIIVNGKEVLVAGVADPAGHPGPDPVAGFNAGPEAAFKILLSHRPGLANQASSLGFDLQLSGHTHGGQFFPWTIAVRFAHKYFLGHYLIKDMWLNVNSGTGSWGPFMRLGTTSEITLIEIVRSDKSLE